MTATDLKEAMTMTESTTQPGQIQSEAFRGEEGVTR